MTILSKIVLCIFLCVAYPLHSGNKKTNLENGWTLTAHGAIKGGWALVDPKNIPPQPLSQKTSLSSWVGNSVAALWGTSKPSQPLSSAQQTTK